MENLAIAQHWDPLYYASSWGGGYWPWGYKFEVGNYV